MENPVLDFGIDASKLNYIGEGLQRPECILAEKDGTLWSADSRGGVVKLSPEEEKSGRESEPETARDRHRSGLYVEERLRVLGGARPFLTLF